MENIFWRPPRYLELDHLRPSRQELFQSLRLQEPSYNSDLPSQQLIQRGMTPVEIPLRPCPRQLLFPFFVQNFKGRVGAHALLLKAKFQKAHVCGYGRRAEVKIHVVSQHRLGYHTLKLRVLYVTAYASSGAKRMDRYDVMQPCFVCVVFELNDSLITSYMQMTYWTR